MQDQGPLEIRPLVPAARTDSPERNDKKFVAVNPFGYETPFGEVLGHKRFEVGDGGLLHDTCPSDVHPGVSSRVRTRPLGGPEVPSLVSLITPQATEEEPLQQERSCAGSCGSGELSSACPPQHYLTQVVPYDESQYLPDSKAAQPSRTGRTPWTIP
jgi:hypothetical protein